MKEPIVTVAEFESYCASRKDAAERLGCSRQTLYDWVEAGGRIPGNWAWKAKAIIESLRDN